MRTGPGAARAIGVGSAAASLSTARRQASGRGARTKRTKAVLFQHQVTTPNPEQQLVGEWIGKRSAKIGPATVHALAWEALR